MKFLASLFLFFTVIRADLPREGEVLVLGSDNFDEALQTYDQILVEFYAPWCGHCKKLEPEWSAAAVTLKDSEIKLAKVDATQAKELANDYEIKGFPTIKFFKKGKATDYNGGRTTSEIVAWVNKKSGPIAKTIATEEDLVALEEANEASILGVFESVDSINARNYLKLASDSEDELAFAISTSEAIRSKLGLTSDTIVVLKQFDDKRADLTIGDTFDEKVVTTFINGETVPIIREFSQESSRKIFKSPITKHVLVFTKKTASHHEPTMSTVKAVAATRKGELLFVNVPSNPETTRVLEYFDLKEEQLPVIVLADMNPGAGNMKKFPYTGAIEVEPLAAFFTDFFTGNLKAVLKSEKPAPEDTAGPVVVVKGESFDDLVINNTKDIFLEFYAPWCGHCKSLAPTWDALGKKFAGVDGVVIAKMDATANEIDNDSLAAKGFPTIYFLKGNDKSNPLKYEGARELDDLLDFVKEHATNKFSHDEL